MKVYSENAQKVFNIDLQYRQDLSELAKPRLQLSLSY